MVHSSLFLKSFYSVKKNKYIIMEVQSIYIYIHYFLRYIKLGNTMIIESGTLFTFSGYLQVKTIHKRLPYPLLKKLRWLKEVFLSLPGCIVFCYKICFWISYKILKELFADLLTSSYGKKWNYHEIVIIKNIDEKKVLRTS